FGRGGGLRAGQRKRPRSRARVLAGPAGPGKVGRRGRRGPEGDGRGDGPTHTSAAPGGSSRHRVGRRGPRYRGLRFTGSRLDRGRLPSGRRSVGGGPRSRSRPFGTGGSRGRAG